MSKENLALKQDIATMKKISQVFDHNKDREELDEIRYEATPRIYSYGAFNLTNFIKEKDEKSVSYFIMPLYDMNL